VAARAPAERARRARRFRVAFFAAVALGVLPAAVSGVALVSRYRLSTLCAEARPLEGAVELAARLRWERVHELGRWGAMVAGVLVLAYGAAWLLEGAAGRRARRVGMVLLVGVLLPSLAAAVWTGRAVPWRLLAPMVWLGERAQAPEVLLGRAPEEAGGPAYCAAHAREVANLRRGWIAHVASGGVALALALALAELGARWRRARDDRDAR
jgi:hypothetical protein